MEKEIVLIDGREAQLRELREGDDVFALAEFINAFVDNRDYLIIDEKLTPEEEAAWLRGRMASINNNLLIDWRLWLGGKCVGGVHAERGKWKMKGNVELGIALSKEIQGQGIGRQLLSEMIAEARRRWSPKNIVIRYIAGNSRAKGLYESMGFVEIARLPSWISHFGEYRDEIVMVLG